MRIISGTHKGRRIIAPKKLPVRPTTDMAKEALFNILQNSYLFGDIKVLDLYAGTGNISFEFASRGCQKITAVDTNPHCIRFIERTTIALSFPISTVKSGALEYLEKTSETYDIIFADPPYNQEQVEFENLLNLIVDKALLKKDGMLIIEHSKHTDLSVLTQFEKSRNYGSSVFSFFPK
jgi:16S rRNA (guanine(966)-N(2))-methyltransferase RsmD